MIPEIIAKGERSEDGHGANYDYTLIDNTRLRVTTTTNKWREEFTNFYSKRKPLQPEYRQAQKWEHAIKRTNNWRRGFGSKDGKF